MARIAVLGAGSWGTALAALLVRNAHAVHLCARDHEVVADIAVRHENQRYLPGIVLPQGLRASTDLGAALAGVDWVLIAVPSHAFAQTVVNIATAGVPSLGVAWASKGFEPGSGRFLHEVAREHLGPTLPLALITGPSFAREVAIGLPTAVTVHSDDATFATCVAECLQGPNFRAYTGNDILGAELGGAMKNVLAVATGVADGMGLGLNARAGLITRGLNEMLRLNHRLGGRAETLMGLAGLGDLVLTCTGDLSRNRRLGLALGAGKSVREAVREIGQVVESVQTVDEVMRLARRHAIDLPISALVQQLLHEQITPAEGLRSLLQREVKPEYPEQLFH